MVDRLTGKLVVIQSVTMAETDNGPKRVYLVDPAYPCPEATNGWRNDYEISRSKRLIQVARG